MFKSWPFRVLGPGLAGLWLTAGLISCTSEPKSAEGVESGNDTGPLVSQRSTGSIIPYAPRGQASSQELYVPGANTSVALWKTRATVSDGTLPTSGQVRLDLVEGGGISETSELQLVAPFIHFQFTGSAGEPISREALRRDLVIESIVDRYVDQENIVGIIVFNFKKQNEERWLLEPKNVHFEVAEDRSRTIRFMMRDTDFVFSLGAVRPKRLPQGWKIFTPPPPDNTHLTASSDGVRDAPTEINLTWTPAEGSRAGYRLKTSYAPFEYPACVDGRFLSPSEITSVRQEIPAVRSDSITVSGLLAGQKVYIQLCSANARSPNDISEGVVVTHEIPARATAVLKDAPSATTNTTALAIKIMGTNVSAYKYALLESGTPCDQATYSVWRPISVQIQENLEEKAYALCVLGKVSETNLQIDPTKLEFQVDRTPPAPFTLTPPTETLTSRSPEILWTQATGASHYEIGIASDAACSTIVHSGLSSSAKLANLALADGQYYLCVTAKDAAGNSRLSANNGLHFTVDATPPGSFQIEAPHPSSTLYVNTPTVTWSPATGASFYDYKVGSDASCTPATLSGQNLVGLSDSLAYLVPGSYHLCVVAKDNAGNATPATNSGLPFKIATGEWTPMASAGLSMTPRATPLAVWAQGYGQLLVWGGSQDGSLLQSGARYDLQSDAWYPMSAVDAPAARRGASALWENHILRMIIWGGENSSFALLNDGAFYEPGGNWTRTALDGAPSGRKDHTAILAGDDMIVWGGTVCSGAPSCSSSPTNTGGILHIPSNTWQNGATDITDTNLPAPRSKHTAIWTGASMIIWGGFDGTRELQSGGRFTPGALDPWLEVATTNAPSARRDHMAVWNGSKMLIWGGYGCTNPPSCTSTGYLMDGGVYDPVSNTWTTINPTGSLSTRGQCAAGWDDTGQRLFIWGGSENASYLSDGGLVSPTLGWTVPQVNQVGAPSARAQAFALWTGTKFILFGGTDGSSDLESGAIFAPP